MSDRSESHLHHAISTSAVFSAALDHLNRESTAHLLGELVREIDAHCKGFPGLISTEIDKIRADLLVLIHALRVDVDALRGKCGGELSQVQLQQIDVLLQRFVGGDAIAAHLSQLKFAIGNEALTLAQLLDVLAAADRVAAVEILYQDVEAGQPAKGRQITGARFRLTDGAEVTFTCTRKDQPPHVSYHFWTPSWKGLPASFLLGFLQHTTEMPMCDRVVKLDRYEGVLQTNLIFDLRALAGVRAGGGAPDIVISDINFRGKGKRQSGEYVEIQNRGAAPADLSGWRISAGDAGQDFVFPQGSVLAAGHSWRVFTNEDHPETGGFSFGSRRPIWNDQGDVASLFRPDGTLAAQLGYGNKRTP
jgi:hypothetical protein